MDNDDIEIVSVLAKQDQRQQVPVKPNVGHKRRRSVNPSCDASMPPKLNSLRGPQCIESGRSLKSESTNFMTLVSRSNEIPILANTDNSSRKIEQYGTPHENNLLIEQLTNQDGTKRMKLERTDVSTQYIIVQCQHLNPNNSIQNAENQEKILAQSKTNYPEYPLVKRNCIANSSSQQQNAIARPNMAMDGGDFSIANKLNLHQLTQISVIPNEKSNHEANKNNSMETSNINIRQDSHLQDKSSPQQSKHTMPHIITDKLHTLNADSHSTLRSLSLLKPKSEKPIVIMQQLLAPANRTNSAMLKRILLPGSNRTVTTNFKSVKIEQKISIERASLPKSNESSCEPKHSISKENETQDDQETDFLLKKEFPVISSSQVDSVLKAIDMQGLNRKVIPSGTNTDTKEHCEDSDIKDTRLLPATQESVKLSEMSSNQCTNIFTHPETMPQPDESKIRNTNEEPVLECSKSLEKFVDKLQCYKCKECSYMSLNEKHIFEHITKEHLNLSGNDNRPTLKCPGCSNTFHYDASLLSHIVHDHQVQEAEAQILVQRICCQKTSIVECTDLKTIENVDVKKMQDQQMFVSQTPDPLYENQRVQNNLNLTPQVVSTVNIPQLESHPIQSTGMIENSGLHYIQNINSIPVMTGNDLETMDITNVQFLNDMKILPTDSNDQQIQPVPLTELKNVDCCKSFDLLELKSGEFVNLKNESQHEGGRYLKEEKKIVDTPVDLPQILPINEVVTEDPEQQKKAAKIKKKGKPKGSETNSRKSQFENLKQGYKCEVSDCGVRMLAQENIVYHQNSHIPANESNNMSFQCPECLEFKSNNWNNLAGHLWRSHIIDMELHACDLCSYKTPCLSNLVNQHRGIHSDERPYLCDNCGKGFKTTKQLRNHRALHRAKAKKPLECEICKRVFTNTRLLKLHNDGVHNESKPFTCNSCTYSASTRSALKLHLRRHTGEKPFSCEQCSYSTGDHNSLRRHKLRHLGLKPYSCPHCSYACIQSSTFKVHLKNKHPGLDHGLMFPCQYCSYKSIKKENLLTHMAKHEQQSSNKIPAGPGSSILTE